MTTAVDAVSSAATLQAATPKSEAGSSDRFLKLLVTQLQNQDPLNPMDNAELTSQMAQINTVTGIENLNTSIQSLHAQFVQSQALQGASLIGRDVTVDGKQLALDGTTAKAGFSLDGPADAVQVEILNAAGKVVDTMQLGAQESGRHGFTWDAAKHPDADQYTFRVSASLNAGKVTSQTLMLDRVQSVGLDAKTGLMLNLERSGSVAFGSVHALN